MQRKWPAGSGSLPLGGFPRARILWCGASERSRSLLDLVQTLNNGLAGCGFRPEQRTFRPHVTKARPLPTQGVEPPVVWLVSGFALVIARPGECPGIGWNVAGRWFRDGTSSTPFQKNFPLKPVFVISTDRSK